MCIRTPRLFGYSIVPVVSIQQRIESLLLTPFLASDGVSFIQRGEDGKRTHTLSICVGYLYPRARQGFLPFARPLLPSGHLDIRSRKQPTQRLGKIPSTQRRERKKIWNTEITLCCDRRENKRGNILNEYPCWIFPIHGICTMTPPPQEKSELPRSLDNHVTKIAIQCSGIATTIVIDYVCRLRISFVTRKK